MKFNTYLPGRISTDHFIHSVLSVLLVFSLFACSNETNTNTIDVPSDQVISESVEAQLESAPDVPAENIDIGTTNGIVKLSGSIDNLLAKQRATELTKTISGVISVINNLKVTVDRPDEAVKTDADRALSTDPATEDWEIATEVNNGKVTLKGSVDSWQEKKLAAAIVSGVKGVKSIENNILVSVGTSREDSNIEDEVSEALKFDSRIRNNLIDVGVENDTVRLSGSVGSATEKSLAIKKAYVRGVESVEADRLKVRPEYNRTRFLDETLSSVTNKEIKEALYKTLSYDPRVPADNIAIKIKNGKAILGGNVKNLNAKMAAEEDAKNTSGITEVENNITVERKVVVKPEIPTTDEAIKTRIKNGILRDPYVEEVEISINVDKGIVELSGNVDSEFEKKQIGQIALDVKGVIAINNNLNIESQEN